LADDEAHHNNRAWRHFISKQTSIRSFVEEWHFFWVFKRCPQVVSSTKFFSRMNLQQQQSFYADAALFDMVS